MFLGVGLGLLCLWIGFVFGRYGIKKETKKAPGLNVWRNKTGRRR